jgi:myo-inositol-1(or 4)-monophosphatase
MWLTPCRSDPFRLNPTGLAYKGELVLGLIMDPFRDECFTAALGGGAFLNNVPITVGDAAVPSDAVVCTGYGSIQTAGPMLRGARALNPFLTGFRFPAAGGEK